MFNACWVFDSKIGCDGCTWFGTDMEEEMLGICWLNSCKGPNNRINFIKTNFLYSNKLLNYLPERIRRFFSSNSCKIDLFFWTCPKSGIKDIGFDILWKFYIIEIHLKILIFLHILLCKEANVKMDIYF